MDDEKDMPRVVTRGERLLFYQTLERAAFQGSPPADEATLIALGIVLSTCHSCGDDLPPESEELLCPSCLLEVAQRLN